MGRANGPPRERAVLGPADRLSHITARSGGRWATDRVMIEDDGIGLRIEPLPDDPIGTAFGSLAGGSKLTSDEMRRRFREEEALADERKWGR